VVPSCQASRAKSLVGTPLLITGSRKTKNRSLKACASAQLPETAALLSARH
jgi:hypothetical protein